MHQTIINLWGILNDCGQWIALVVLLADRVVARRRMAVAK
jgi:hypothetical protein